MEISKPTHGELECWDHFRRGVEAMNDKSSLSSIKSWFIEVDVNGQGYALAVLIRKSDYLKYYLTRQWTDNNILRFDTEDEASVRLVDLYKRLSIIQGRICSVSQHQFKREGESL